MIQKKIESIFGVITAIMLIFSPMLDPMITVSLGGGMVLIFIMLALFGKKENS